MLEKYQMRSIIEATLQAAVINVVVEDTTNGSGVHHIFRILIVMQCVSFSRHQLQSEYLCFNTV